MVERVQDEIVVIMRVSVTVSVTVTVTTVGSRSPGIVLGHFVKRLEEFLEARNATGMKFGAAEKITGR